MAAGGVEVIEAGQGPLVVLLPSSVSGARQWRAMMQDLSGRYRLLAFNLYGYGATPAWPGRRPMRLDDAAALIAGHLPAGETFSIVGHSTGASVAMAAAARFGARVDRLVLIEPNAFFLLPGASPGRAEAEWLCGLLKDAAARGAWADAAAAFCDYWTGSGAWDAMPPDRRERFIAALPPLEHEVDAVLDEPRGMADFAAALPAATTLVTTERTTRAVTEIADAIRAARPDWRHLRLDGCGHMAPLSHPGLVNPVIAEALR